MSINCICALWGRLASHRRYTVATKPWVQLISDRLSATRKKVFPSLCYIANAPESCVRSCNVNLFFTVVNARVARFSEKPQFPGMLRAVLYHRRLKSSRVQRRTPVSQDAQSCTLLCQLESSLFQRKHPISSDAQGCTLLSSSREWPVPAKPPSYPG